MDGYERHVAGVTNGPSGGVRRAARRAARVLKIPLLLATALKTVGAGLAWGIVASAVGARWIM